MSGSGAIDYLNSPLEEILMAQKERLEQAEAKAERLDEAVMLMEWALAKLPAQHAHILSPREVLAMLGAVAVYSATGRTNEWMEMAREQMGR